jgi:hypothetical protein
VGGDERPFAGTICVCRSRVAADLWNGPPVFYTCPLFFEALLIAKLDIDDPDKTAKLLETAMRTDAKKTKQREQERP